MVDPSPAEITVTAESHPDDVAAAFEQVEDALLDLHDAIEALDQTEATAVRVADNRVPVRVGDILDVHVSVEFETTPIDDAELPPN